MKKAGIIIGSVFVLVLGAIWYNRQQKEVLAYQQQLAEEKTQYPEIYDTLNSITVESFEEKVSNQEDFVVYVGRPTCLDCSDFEPALILMLEKYELHSKLEYLNVAQLRKDETAWGNFKETYAIQYTPTIATFEKGKLISQVSWTPEKGTEIDRFDDYLSEIAKN
ncbi:thioredoxin family protein [Enterococcus sp. LJL51]|uniref:thioredoxin family protein n=1 Tax=Enterococcus sp. LJL51 TaxID=3416656 RepID=UPI003CF6591D